MFLSRRKTTMPPLLSYYQEIEGLSTNMLVAAQSGHWDQVVQLEARCVQLINQLKHAAHGQTLNPDDARAKANIMQRILSNDTAMRDLMAQHGGQVGHPITHGTQTLH